MHEVMTTATKCEEDLTFNADSCVLRLKSFDDVPPAFRREVYGVAYVELTDVSGGSTWVTRHGWDFLEHVDPLRWYVGHRYDREGEHLSKGSGSVFRVVSEDSVGRSVNLVVKFSRMAQDLPLQVSSRFPDGVPRHVLDEAVFNDPFEEFCLLKELRTGEFGTPDVSVRTKRPLAIYSPARSLKPWQLGRSKDQFQQHARRIARDQRALGKGVVHVELSFDRQYITLFQWVRGQDAETLVKAGVISESQATQLVRQVIEDLTSKGFRMLDIKPNHIILRRRLDGSLVMRHGRPSYALVDFELLQRTEEYQLWRDTHANSGV